MPQNPSINAVCNLEETNVKVCYPIQASSGGVILSVVGGTDISVDNTDPLNPIVNYVGVTSTPDLQAVTNVGAATTNGISVYGAGLSATDIQPTYAMALNFVTNQQASINADGSLRLNNGAALSYLYNSYVTTGNNVVLQFPNKPTGNYTIATTADLGIIDLQTVTDNGNTTNNDIEFVPNAGILLGNGSRLREGTIDAGTGGNKGIAQICAVGYELKWEAGTLYVMDGNGVLIRESRYNFSNIPTTADDNTKGYYVGSRWVLDNGDVYVCNNATTGAAVWNLQSANGITGQGIVSAIPRVLTIDGSSNIVTVESSDFVDYQYITTLIKDGDSTVDTIGLQFQTGDTSLSKFTNIQTQIDSATCTVTISAVDQFDLSSVVINPTNVSISSPNIQIDTLAKFVTNGAGGTYIQSLPDGTSGDYLTTDGAGNYSWAAPSVGTVTSISTSGLISGGTITTSGTISTSMNTNRLVGRSTASVGEMEEITVGTGLVLSGGTLSATATSGILHATASGTDTYTATITGVTAYNDGDAYLIRFTNGNTTSCTLDINGLGAVSLYRNNDGALIGGDIWAGGEMLCIYNSTLGGFQCIGTSPNSLFAYVTNADSVTINKGQPVYAFGAAGNRMSVKLANNTSDATSAKTVGIVYSTSIATNQKGIIIVQGMLEGLSSFPLSTWADGDTVYLGSTAGAITPTKQYAPNHLVYLGVVTTASNGAAGRMYVRVQNGYELDELHNVQAQTPSLNDTLYYDSSVSPAQWKTASIATILGYTPQAQLNGTGFVKASGTTISYDNSTYLTSALTSLNSLTGASQTFATGTTGTDFAISSTGTTHTFNLPTASATNRGLLSSANWSTFNGKQDALSSGTNIKTVGGISLLGSGDLGIITGTYGGTGVNNGSKTITLGGNLTTTGAFNTTFSVPATATYTLPSATSTLLANNLGITGGSTWISGTAAADKAIIQSTSNATHTAGKNLFKFKKNGSADATTSVAFSIGDGDNGVSNDRVQFWALNNSAANDYFIHAGASFSYFNATTDLRLLIANTAVLNVSSSTVTMTQGLTISDGKNINFGTSTGTKFGTLPLTEKIAFWNKTPIVQPTIGIAGATRVGGAGTTVTTTDTYGGYTIAQIAQALINLGLLA